MRNFLSNKRALKALLGATLGTGIAYGTYRYAYQPKNEESKAILPDIHETKPHLITQALNQPPKEQKMQQNKQEVKIQQPAEEKMQEKKEVEEKKQQKHEKRYFQHLKEVKQFKRESEVGRPGQVLIVADLPYNEQFQAKIVDQINKITQKIDNVRIYKKDFSNKQQVAAFEKEFKVKVRDQTIFILQNNYDRGMNNIDFDMFMQYPTLIQHYLKDVQCNNDQNVDQVVQRLAKLSPHQSTLIYLYDKNQPSQKQKERMLAAKYIEMEMVLNNLYGVKLEVVDKQAAVKANLINPQNSRTNSVHLFRKHNIYTPYDPNYYLKADNETQPFHRLADIALFAKGGQNLLVKQYLSNLQTFDAIANPAPFMCTLRVDRNRISDEDYTKLLRIFGQLKRKNKFSDICFSLKLKKIPYGGKDSLPNKQWMITLTNLDELDKESMMHEIKTKEQLDLIGFKEKDYLKSTHQYIYEHNVFNEDLIVEFLEKGSKGQLPKYFRSQEESSLNVVRKLVGSEFNHTVLDDDKDHFVYQYSEFCPTCKRISPIIGSFTKVVQQKRLGLQNVQFHKFDANKNRVKGQLSSPYIPNIFYYKNEWKKGGPVRFPIEMLGTQGLISLYTFCAITHEIKTMPWSNVDKAIESAKMFNWKQFETF